MGKKSKFGPGFLVAAAFIGPGTVTTATLAGASFGYSLIWVVLIAILAAVVLQEMVGRFSLSVKIDVATALVRLTKNKWLKHGFQILAFLAIIVGCTAYEAGNIVGGSLGLVLSFPVIRMFPKDVEQYFPGLFVSQPTMILGLAAALAVGVLAAGLPAWRAARGGIAEALRRVG